LLPSKRRIKSFLGVLSIECPHAGQISAPVISLTGGNLAILFSLSPFRYSDSQRMHQLRLTGVPSAMENVLAGALTLADAASGILVNCIMQSPEGAIAKQLFAAAVSRDSGIG
jgi:hypothetical protein